eukprot:121822-Chlamydomonas_euryale.AAC.1
MGSGQNTPGREETRQDVGQDKTAVCRVYAPTLQWKPSSPQGHPHQPCTRRRPQSTAPLARSMRPSRHADETPEYWRTYEMTYRNTCNAAVGWAARIRRVSTTPGMGETAPPEIKDVK